VLCALVLRTAADCQSELSKDCAKTIGKGQDCFDCAEAHEVDLKLHKCTKQDVRDLCNGSPGPSPGPGPTGDTLKLELVPGTHCLDGTQAGYYYGAGSGTGSNVWVIFLQGGGACSDEVDCKKRANMALGSSKKWASSMDAKSGGPSNKGSQSVFLVSDEAANPDFHNVNRVYVGYCSGDSHFGTQTAATAGTFGLYFSGAVNLQAILTQLKSVHGMAAATHVLLHGHSAGGTGTFHNTDAVAAAFGDDVVVKGAPMGGWFVPAETGDLNATLPAAQLHRISPLPPTNFANWSAGVVGGWDNATSAAAAATQAVLRGKPLPTTPDAACLAAHPDDAFVCDSVDATYAYTKAPLFVVENRFDTYQLGNVEGLDTKAPHGAGTKAGSYVRYFGRAMAVSVAQVRAKPKAAGGLFFPSCFDHTGNFGLRMKNTISNTTFVAPIGDWFFGRDKLEHFLEDDCGELPCGTGCAM